ncbi:hypothetical protein [Microvirga splendida]|uniref:Uncharacterized protein n=1 Tax=Microvirga splendida TaxID=2795727 RepID=A0ABS0Y2Z7_9HYPH|nr:hypothetical protein [Microvirga splendida]MBJ6126305.1 hypothetical protein [Microvirga splendida]
MTRTRLRTKPRRRSAASAAGLTLARGEDHKAYRALHQAITADTRPCDAIETSLVQTIIDEIWKIQRCRMIEACLLAGPKQDGARQTATAMLTSTSQPAGLPEGQGPAPRRSRLTTPSEADRIAARTTLLAAYQKHAASLEQNVRQRTRAEALRDAAIRDLEWYRNSTLHDAEPEIEDAEFTEVTVDGINPETRSQPAQRPEEHRSPQSNRARSRKPQRA